MKKWIIAGLSIVLSLGVRAETVARNLDVRGGFIYNHGAVNPGDVGLAFTNTGIRDITVSAGQLSGVDPETGAVITNSSNLLSLKAESLTAAGDVTAGGTFVGDGSGLTNLNADSFVGTIHASSLPTSGSWNVSGLTIQNPTLSGDLRVDGYKLTVISNADGYALSITPDLPLSTDDSVLSRSVAAGTDRVLEFAENATLIAEVIIDNTNSTAEVTLNGSWAASTATAGYYGSNYLHDSNTGKGSKSVVFTPTFSAAGDYEVFIRWTSGSNRATNVPVSIVHSGGTASATLNETANGGEWYSVGIYSFGTTGGSVTLSNTGTTGYVVADAVKFTLSTIASEVIIDNTNSTAEVTLNGSWAASTSTAGYYGSNYLHDGNTGKGSKSVVFTPTLSSAGDYEVFLRWTSAANRSASVPVSIVHSGGSTNVTLDQTANGGEWYSVGTYSFGTTGASITLSNTGTSGYVIADAVKFTPATAGGGDLPAGFHVDGSNLLDANGNNFIMRGINHPHTWYPTQTSSIANIKATGANTVRVVLSSGQLWSENSASDVNNIIQQCTQNRLICVLEIHDTIGFGEQAGAASLSEAVSYWKKIQPVLDGQEAYVIINIGNEPYGNINATNWINDTKAAIAQMRSAGFHHTLMVDAPNWGQDWQFIMRNNAADIFNSDPDRNTVFSIHMYGVFDTANEVQNYISTFMENELPLVVGEFGDLCPDGDPDENAIMAQAQANGIGYIAWSWSGNGAGVENLDMVTNFDSQKVTSWGNRVITGTNGLIQTSQEASVYGSDLPAGWNSADIGSVGIPGSTAFNGGVYTVNGSGSTIGSTVDSFQFASTVVTGDCTITARVITQSATSPYARAGVMIRGALTANSMMADAIITPSSGAYMQSRLTDGASVSTGSGGAAAAPYWVRVTRVGNVFTGYKSVDGSTWVQMSTPKTIAMSSATQVGPTIPSVRRRSIT